MTTGQKLLKTAEELLTLTTIFGGSIKCTSSIDNYELSQARASERMYVAEDGIGFVWIPEFKNGFPETVDEVKLFDKYYPLDIEPPDELKTLDWFHKRIKK